MDNLEVNRLYDYKPLRQAPRIKAYYPRPTYADLQLEENLNITSLQFDGRSLVEWNLDGFFKYQIITMCHLIMMYANAYRVQENFEPNIVTMIVSRFSE